MKHHETSPSLVTSVAIRQKAALAVVESPPKRGWSIKQQSRAYFVALGAYIELQRKLRGMTQAELARAIGVSQQAVFAYETGERRVSVIILIKLAMIFSVPLEQLARMATLAPDRAARRRLSPRAARHAERLQGLSKTKQRFVIHIIDLLEFGDVKWSSNQHSRKTV